jgi:Bacterial regulatory proteins, tetR family
MTSRLKAKRAGPAAEKLKDGDAPKRAERRHAIVRATCQTLAEKGFEGLRMREIAKRAGKMMVSQQVDDVGSPNVLCSGETH